MNSFKLICFLGAITAAFTVQAGEINPEFADPDDYSDFSVSGLSEKRTLNIFRAELDRELERWGGKFLNEGETLTIRFTDIDMAGDIQPWRNSVNADIRYIETIYPPRLVFNYALKDAEGTVIDEGEANISDLNFQMNTRAAMHGHSSSFIYELSLLEDWLRKRQRETESSADGA